LKKEARIQIAALLRRGFEDYTQAQAWLLVFSIAMVLVISVHTITHPDTLIYHAKSILSLQRYPSIPGIANLRLQLGFQSSWFAVLALTNPIRQQHNLIFLNGAVLCWFLIFLISCLRGWWMGWLLLAYTLASWTQIRLTASSASPDFIVSLYCWAAILAFLQKGPASRNSYLALTIIFCMGTVLTKMSGMVILLLAVPAIVGSRWGGKGRLLAWCLLSFAILCVKNIIASGYMLYPSSWPDLFHARWKIPAMHMQYLREYIRSYATMPFAEQASPLSPGQRFTAWWKYIEAPDHLLLIAVVAGMLVWLVLSMKSRYRPMLFRENKFALLVALAGSCLWLFSAPNPRFGTGFIIPLAYFIWYPIPRPGMPALPPKFFRLTANCFMAAIAAYTAYRVVRFTSPTNLILPGGIAGEAYIPIGCEKAKVDLLHDTIIYSPGLPADCPSRPFSSFQPIGSSIREGFVPAPDP
jgi:hypothetical protein